MKLLELFCGTKSIQKAIGSQYEEVVSLDFNEKYNPTICCNILEWDYKVYPPGYFHTIWSSPDCTQYSKAKTTGTRDIETANRVVQKTIEIIKYFDPELWFIENPQTGLLKKQPFMKDLPYVDFDYCQYGFSYRKRTRIWTNKLNITSCLCNRSTCKFIKDNRHINSCGNGYKTYTKDNIKKEQKYTIPFDLIVQLFGKN
jgi:site-specific DNA-cytosine methylase